MSIPTRSPILIWLSLQIPMMARSQRQVIEAYSICSYAWVRPVQRLRYPGVWNVANPDAQDSSTYREMCTSPHPGNHPCSRSDSVNALRESNEQLSRPLSIFMMVFGKGGPGRGSGRVSRMGSSFTDYDLEIGQKKSAVTEPIPGRTAFGRKRPGQNSYIFI